MREIKRLGAASAVAGTALFGLSGALHGDLPAADAAQALAYIAARPYWPAIHIGSILGVLGWLGAFVALADSLREPRARALGRVLVPVTTVGVALLALDYAVDGFGFRALAERWADAPVADRAAVGATMDTVLTLVGGLFRGYIALLFGVPFVLAGAALLLEGREVRTLALVALVPGAVSLVAGVSGFVGLPLVPDALLFTLVLGAEQVWLVLLGLHLWRGAGARVASGA
jgi:hypothetical protein